MAVKQALLYYTQLFITLAKIRAKKGQNFCAFKVVLFGEVVVVEFAVEAFASKVWLW